MIDMKDIGIAIISIVVATIGLFALSMYFGPTISTKQNVRVTITDVYCDEDIHTHYVYGKDYILPIVRDSERYMVEVSYEGNIYELEDKSLYQKYKNNIGTEVMAVLEINTYRNGKIDYEMISIY